MQNPNARDDDALQKASDKLDVAVPKLVSAMWAAGGDQGAIEAALLDAARAAILDEVRGAPAETK